MSFSLTEFMSNISFSEPQGSENLLVFPLLKEEGSDQALQCLLLEEALEKGSLVIVEISSEGTVNTISVENNAGQPVLILDGEELLGAKQNRIINATILVPPRSKINIPVSCVEQGRWRYNSSAFNSSEFFAYSSLRRQKVEQVAGNLESNQDFASDQGAIWHEIRRKQSKMKTRSSTGAMNDIYKNYKKEIERIVSGIESVPKQVGAAVFINGRFTCIDLFDCPEILKKIWPKLLGSYAIEALEFINEEKLRENPDIKKLIKAVSDVKYKEYPSVGMGTDIRIRGENIIGAGLIFEQRLFHLSVFAKHRSSTPDIRSGMSRPRNRRENM
ncbi:MAG: hypothetical protein CVU88_07230 [Firmicutes bacterium HGW-Firmicutes-13]|nr:MAG: hypothetical protein CVU88_07230 [Firmicutes bacterium HGW-Firmicutes-13]